MPANDGPPPTDLELAQLNQDQAAWWFANGCPEPPAAHPGPRPPRPTPREIASYRSLPAGTREDLKRLVTQAKSRVVDGQTHQFWDWSNGDVASLLAELTGDPEFIIAACGAGGWCRMTAAGHRIHRASASTPGGESDPYHRRPVAFTHAGPDLRYTARPPADESGRHPGAFPLCVSGLPSYTDDDFDPRAIDDLRKVYTSAVSQQRHAADVRERRRDQARAERRTTIANVVFWVVVLVGIVCVVVCVSS